MFYWDDFNDMVHDLFPDLSTVEAASATNELIEDGIESILD
jgi:hypothetical protein